MNFLNQILALLGLSFITKRSGYINRVSEVFGGSITVGPANSGALYSGDGVNDEDVINKAIDICVANGGGKVQLTPGVFNLRGPVIMKSNVHLCGSGRSTILKTFGTSNGEGAGFAAINGFGSTGTPLQNLSVTDLQIDGLNFVCTAWDANSKGIYMTHIRRALFRNLFIINTPASGLGVDYLIESVIENVVAIQCGRQFVALGGTVGGNGIGIGTGAFPTESLSVTNCHARACGNNGIMFEEQNTGGGAGAAQGHGNVVTGCTAVGNGTGFRVSSCHSISFVNCQAKLNTTHGWVVGATYITTPSANTRVTLTGCQSYENTNAGIAINSAGIATPLNSQLIITGCQFSANIQEGIKITGVASHVTITDNIIRGNARDGILFDATGAMRNVVISNNLICANSFNDVGTYVGLKITQSGSGSVDGFIITGNSIYDDQGTKTQNYGIRLVGTSTNVSIFGNDVRNNITAGIIFATANATAVVRDNPGYNPVGVSAITVGASPFTYTAGNSPENVRIFGGTVSGVTKNGTTVASATGTTVELAPNQAIIVTYSGLPTMVKDAR